MSEVTHPFWKLPLNNGSLTLTPCPGTQEVSLESSLTQLKEAGVTALITLLSDQEIENAGLERFFEAIEKVGLDSFHLPVPDDDLPGETFENQWQALLPEIEKHLHENNSIAIHCMGGSGRTGLIAGRLMLNQGFAPEEIISQIRALRPKAFSMDVQKHYLHAFA